MNNNVKNMEAELDETVEVVGRGFMKKRDLYQYPVVDEINPGVFDVREVSFIPVWMAAFTLFILSLPVIFVIGHLIGARLMYRFLFAGGELAVLCFAAVALINTANRRRKAEAAEKCEADTVECSE